MTPEQWILSDDTGVSSTTIWAVMMGAVDEDLGYGTYDFPYDPDDFGRCHRLLEAIPEWRDRLPEVAEVFPIWRPFVDNWDEMTRLYLRDLPTGRCRELYELMQTFRPHEDNF